MGVQIGNSHHTSQQVIQDNTNKMAELTPKDMERARFAFDIYDFEGKARMDLFYLGDVLRGLNLNPTLKMIEKLGGTKKKGEKFLKLESINAESSLNHFINFQTGKNF